jgi:hypothetical protein
LYNITLHPLAHIPGPKLRGAFHFPRYIDIWRGNPHLVAIQLHKRYGRTVRVAPSAVSFNNPEAWLGKIKLVFGRTYQGAKLVMLRLTISFHRGKKVKQGIAQEQTLHHF